MNYRIQISFEIETPKVRGDAEPTMGQIREWAACVLASSEIPADNPLACNMMIVKVGTVRATTVGD